MQLPILGPALRPLWILLAVLLTGYMLGTWLGRRRSMAVGRWLAAGIGVLGGRTQWQWIGTMSSGAQVTIVGAGKPFRQAEVMYLLLMRDLLPLWGIQLLQRKSDTLVLRAELSAKPAREFEVVPISGSLRATLDRNPGAVPWRWQELPAGLGLATRSDPGGHAAAAVRKFVEVYGPFVQRLSLSKSSPQLILLARLTGLERTPSKEFLACVRDVVVAIESKG